MVSCADTFRLLLVAAAYLASCHPLSLFVLPATEQVGNPAYSSPPFLRHAVPPQVSQGAPRITTSNSSPLAPHFLYSATVPGRRLSVENTIDSGAARGDTDSDDGPATRSR